MTKLSSWPARTTCRRCLGRGLAATLTTAVILAAAAPTSAADRPMRFDHLTIRDGLSQSSVLAIHQDRDGFVWLATEDGLNRFDGRTVVRFEHDSADPGSLPNDFIWDIDEDANGDLWLATEGGGVVRYERSSGRFAALRNDPRDAASLASDFIRTLEIDARGSIWIGTRGAGVDRLDPRSGAIEHHRHETGNDASLPSDYVYAVVADQAGSLWIGTDAGLARLDPSSGRLTRFAHDPADDTSLSNDRVLALYEDRSGTLWAGTRRGLNRFLPDRGGFARYLHAADDATSLAHNLVRSIHEDSEQRLWVGTAGGLNLLDREANRFSRYRSDRSNPDSLGGDEVMSLFQDRGGLLWVGTRVAGVSRWNPRTWSFGHRLPSPADEQDGAARLVTAFAEGADGRIRIGTMGSGIRVLDLESGRHEQIRAGGAPPRGLSDDRVMALLTDSRGALWAGTMHSGLNRLDAGATRFEVFRHAADDPGSLPSDSIMSLYEDGAGDVWVGTFGGGASRFDRARGSFESFSSDPAVSGSLSSPRVTAFAEDAAGALWIGTHNGGLNLLDRQTGRARHYRHDIDDPSSLASDDVYALHVDRSGVLWVGTTAGLNRLQGSAKAPDRVRFERYTVRDGLPNEVVYGIRSDDKGNLWLSTNRGLSRFNPTSQTFENFGRSHGLQADEFNFGAHFQTASGDLLFGGNNGFNAFHPDRLARNEAAPPVVLTAFQKLDQTVETGVPLSRLEQIELEHDDDIVSFEFAALDFSAPGQNRFAYLLEGFHSDWIDLGTVNRTTFTDLAPGRYTLRVKAANADGTVNESGLAIALIVRPAWWQTWWARGGAGLLAMLVVAAVVGTRRRLVLSLGEAAGARGDGEPAGLVKELEVRIAQLEAENRRLREASRTDPVTGLRNRRSFADMMTNEIALVRRRHQDRADAEADAEALDLVFMKIDLDGFRAVNETHGTTVGDHLLADVGGVLQRACRASDLLFRWQNDEFVLVARNTDPERAERLAERLRSRIASRSFRCGGHKFELTCSLGFTSYPFPRRRPGLYSDEAVLALADHALHEASQHGDSWVGLVASDTGDATDETVARISLEEPEVLVEKGLLEVRRSVSDAAA